MVSGVTAMDKYSEVPRRARPSLPMPALARVAEAAGQLGRSVAHVVPTVLLIVILNFFLLRLTPGDAADVAAGEQGAATTASMAQLRHHFGLDVPLWQQFAHYLWRILHLDLGYSYRYSAPVLDVILSRLPATLALMGASYVLGLVVGVGTGAVMASWRGRWPDRVLNGVCVLLYSTPSFCVGILLVLAFSVGLGWLPSDGLASFDPSLSGLPWLADRLGHLVLPTLALSTHSIAVYARLTRTAMIEVRQLDFVRTARAKGVPPVALALRHVLRNALIPVSTVAGLQFATLLGGAATVEMVFSWPGVGRLALDVLQARDYNCLLGILFLSSLVVVLANLLIDLWQYRIDPRTRRSAYALQGGGA